MERLQQRVTALSTRVKPPSSKRYVGTGETIYFADVDSDSAKVVEGGIYKYSADLYFKQFSENTFDDEKPEYIADVIDGDYKAGTDVTVLSHTQLSGGQLIPCIARGGHFEPIQASAPVMLPWEPYLELVNERWQLTIKNCGYTRGPFTILLDDLEFSLPTEPSDGEGTYYIGVAINMDTGLPDSGLKVAQTLYQLFEVEEGEEKEIPIRPYFTKVLYTFLFTLEDDVGKWSIHNTWYRLMPDLGAYV